MRLKKFVVPFLGTVRAESVALQIAAWPARVHLLLAPSTGHTPDVLSGRSAHRDRVRVRATSRLRRTARVLARAALRTAYAGGPLTPAGYAILAVTVAAIALAAMLSVSPASAELNRRYG
ncbi:hypothetical protein [Caballeronia sp. RCC_10]|uniref:hypothetical protein n=1 Tax=Caballeronia sp. RCC_10 TaxID=3239227 RepID=UPI003524A535